MDKQNYTPINPEQSRYKEELHHQLSEYQKAVHSACDTIIAEIDTIMEDFDFTDRIAMIDLQSAVIAAFAEAGETLLSNSPFNCAKVPLDALKELPDDVIQTINPEDYPDGEFPY